jgi:hypothetical protein
MPYIKSSSFLIILFLGSFCHAFAQTDSGTLHRNPDTLHNTGPALPGESAGIHHSADSIPPQKPKLIRKPGSQKKSDSAFFQPSNGSLLPGTRKDSLIRGNGVAGTDHVSLFKSVLRSNSYFNFAGLAFVELMERHIPDSKDTLFYLLVGILFYFALIRIFFEKYFDNLLTLFFRVSIRHQQIREQVLQTPLPSLLLNILFVISGGLYASWLVRYYHFAGNINFWILLINCMAALGVIYLGKFLLLKFCGWVFNISRATDIYIFVVFLVNKMMGIFLMPFLVILFFSAPVIRDVFVTISLSMIFIFFAYRVVASYRPIRNEIKLTPFHFFLYLCAFEIAPLLLIYKVLLSYLEKAY